MKTELSILEQLDKIDPEARQCLEIVLDTLSTWSFKPTSIITAMITIMVNSAIHYGMPKDLFAQLMITITEKTLESMEERDNEI